MQKEYFVLKVGNSFCLEILTYGVYIRIGGFEKFIDR